MCVKGCGFWMVLGLNQAGAPSAATAADRGRCRVFLSFLRGFFGFFGHSWCVIRLFVVTFTPNPPWMTPCGFYSTIRNFSISGFWRFHLMLIDPAGESISTQTEISISVSCSTRYHKTHMLHRYVTYSSSHRNKVNSACVQVMSCNMWNYPNYIRSKCSFILKVWLLIIGKPFTVIIIITIIIMIMMRCY